MKALAYVNWGRWVVDCPHPGCTDARKVKPGQREDACWHGHPFSIVMPADEEAAAILGELQRRDQDADRAWYPQGHARAALMGQPTGQTVAELEAETVEVRRRRAAQRAARTEQLTALLAEHGLSVGPDGTISGRL